MVRALSHVFFFNPSPVRRVPIPNRYTAKAKLCFCKNNKRMIGSSACLQCVANSISPGGSINATACVCNAGFVGQLGGPCSACARDTYAYKNTVTNPTGVCMPCPAYSKSEPQSSALTSCKCLLGYGGAAGGPCTPCGLAYYRGSNDSACRQCPPHTTTTSLIANSAAECVGIAGFVTEVVYMPSVNLTMQFPYSLEQLTDDVHAIILLASMRRGIAAAAQVHCDCVVNEQDIYITDVKAGEGTVVEVTYIIEVPTDEDVGELYNLLSLSTINSALQAQGVSISTHDILMVPNTEDIVFAISCEPNTYWTSGSLLATCTACPANSESPSASVSSTACVCKTGFMGPSGGPCDRKCEAGFEARTSDGLTQCDQCRPSYYKTSMGDQDCTECPPNSFSLLYEQTTVTSCLCKQGYIWNSVTNLCDACPPGTSNNNDDETVCYSCNTTCPENVDV
jgi:hypothetical protein